MGTSLRFTSMLGVVFPRRHQLACFKPPPDNLYSPAVKRSTTSFALTFLEASFHWYFMQDSFFFSLHFDLFFTNPSSLSSLLTPDSVVRTWYCGLWAHKYNIKGNEYRLYWSPPNSRKVQENTHTSKSEKSAQAQQFLSVAHKKLRYDKVWREPREVILPVGRD